MLHYPQMAIVSRYLIADRKAEIALARSAAPKGISRNATVLVPETIFMIPASHWSDGTAAPSETAGM